MSMTITKREAIPRLPGRERVAAYARVSAGKDDSLHSLAAQADYYERLIRGNPAWEFAGIYTDEALTGTKAERPAFQQMLADCRAGKIDRILTKSISRFARNTVTVLETVRTLRTLGIDVFFEKENIHSTSADGELMLSLLASFAQEESRSASENQKWRIRKGFARGELRCLSYLLGYRIAHRQITIDPEGAAVVREIFSRAIAGESYIGISRSLNARGLTTVFGSPFTAEHIRQTLMNEKYCGNALLQKTYVVDHLCKRQVVNRGDLPQYYVQGTHPAIIDEATFAAAQEAIGRNAGKHKQYAPYTRSEFTGKLRCTHCGAAFRHVSQHGTVGWKCRTAVEKGVRFCRAGRIPEDTLKAVTASVLGRLVYDPEAVRERIDHIDVPADHQLRFFLKDGTTAARTWKPRSCRKHRKTSQKAASKRKEGRTCPAK